MCFIAIRCVCCLFSHGYVAGARAQTESICGFAQKHSGMQRARTRLLGGRVGCGPPDTPQHE